MNKKYLKTSLLYFTLSILSYLGMFFSFKFMPYSYENIFPYILNNFDQIEYPFLFFILFFFVGIVSFLTGASDLTTFFLEQKKLQNYFLKSVVFIFIFFFLPLYVIIHYYLTFLRLLISKKLFIEFKIKTTLKQIGFILFVVIFLLPIWIVGYFSISSFSTKLVLHVLGYAPITEYVAGTGSMYPTFPKGNKLKPIEQFNETVATPSFISYPSGIVLFDKRYFGRELKKGDIVSFFNKKTAEITKKEYGTEAGFIKRVIALSNDTIELRGGIVYLNSKPIREPYTAKPQSTFGGGFLSECKVIKVPKGSIFVMGDNRKGSGDSREIGFISEKDIDHVLPIENQKDIWDKNWRNTSKDLDVSSKIILNKNEYIKLLNEKRAQANVEPLKYQLKLEISAKLRADTILKHDDFSFSATRSGLTMAKAMQQAGYSNIVYGEAPAQGYFEAAELLENQFQFPDTKKFLLDPEYDDFAVAEVEGELNNCPTQIIVQHFAGYIAPNYSEKVIKSWEELLSSLNKISKSWQELKNLPQIYDKDKESINRINEIILKRQTMISEVLNNMHSNQWLSSAQNEYIKTEDRKLAEEEDQLAKKINNLLSQH